MERVRRLHEFWSWLPAFRAVAETEHLPTASKSLHVTPSALSRTVRLLEEAVGRPLFLREGRTLRLAPEGEVLLRAVREAMRRVDEGLLEVDDAQFTGTVQISAPGPFASLTVLPALAPLAALYPSLVPRLSAHPGGAEVNARLRQGGVDVAVLDDPLPDPGLHLEALVELEHDVFCAPSHPARELPLERALESVSFVAPPLDGRGQRGDAWPVERARRVTLEVKVMQMAIDAVAAGTHVAVFPSRVAEAVGLAPLGVSGLSRTTLYLMHRPSLPSVVGKTEVVAEAVRAHVQTLK